MEKLKRLLSDNPIAPKRGKYFNESHRREALRVTKALSEKIENEGIENLVLVDRSARAAAVALHAYWEKQPITARPKIFFLNPLGGITTEFRMRHKLAAAEIIDQQLQHDLLSHFGELSTDTPEITNQLDLKTDLQTRIEFKNKMKLLDSRKDKKTLLFDTCLHTGSSMLAAKHLLDINGFKNLSLVVATRKDEPWLFPEIKGLVPIGPCSRCTPFGTDMLVRKAMYEPVSKASLPDEIPNGGRRRKASLQSRAELRRVFK